MKKILLSAGVAAFLAVTAMPAMAEDDQPTLLTATADAPAADETADATSS